MAKLRLIWSHCSGPFGGFRILFSSDSTVFVGLKSCLRKIFSGIVCLKNTSVMIKEHFGPAMTMGNDSALPGVNIMRQKLRGKLHLTEFRFHQNQIWSKIHCKAITKL